jgi:hypothetical protein
MLDCTMRMQWKRIEEMNISQTFVKKLGKSKREK